MHISDVFLALGEERFGDLLRHVSMGRLRTYQLFDQIKARLRLVRIWPPTSRRPSWSRLST